MTPEEKKKLKAKFKADEEKKMLESIPMKIGDLKDMLTYLNRVDAPPCNHKLTDTEAWLSTKGIQPSLVIPWLNENGGYCDCEVIYNVYDAVGDMVGWHLDEEED